MLRLVTNGVAQAGQSAHDTMIAPGTILLIDAPRDIGKQLCPAHGPFPFGFSIHLDAEYG